MIALSIIAFVVVTRPRLLRLKVGLAEPATDAPERLREAASLVPEGAAAGGSGGVPESVAAKRD